MSDTLFTAPSDDIWAANDWDFGIQLNMIGEDFNFDDFHSATCTELAMEQPGFLPPNHESLECGNSKSFMTTGERYPVAHCPSLPNQPDQPDQPDHAQEILPQPFTCIECRVSFARSKDLRIHGTKSQHRPFGCVCGKRYARTDVLKRHLNAVNAVKPKYPCKYCKNHRGKNAFPRKDHLVQHIRGYHKFDGDNGIPELLPSPGIFRPQTYLTCPHEGCPKYRASSSTLFGYKHIQEHKSFKSMSDYTKHMREEHNTTPFPCAIAGCERKGAKGYLTADGLRAHHHKVHSGVEYIPKARVSHWGPCPYGCGEPIELEDAERHLNDKHMLWTK